jgi:hypothetical protein
MHCPKFVVAAEVTAGMPKDLSQQRAVLKFTGTLSIRNKLTEATA